VKSIILTRAIQIADTYPLIATLALARERSIGPSVPHGSTRSSLAAPYQS